MGITGTPTPICLFKSAMTETGKNGWSITGRKPTRGIPVLKSLFQKKRSSFILRLFYAGVAKLVDAVDSKSTLSNKMLVRVRSPAINRMNAAVFDPHKG